MVVRERFGITSTPMQEVHFKSCLYNALRALKKAHINEDKVDIIVFLE